MEKQLTIQEQVDIIWNSNSKIPFMQSKEILKLGYIEGRKSIDDKPKIQLQNMNTTENNSNSNPTKSGLTEFVGNTKELINMAESKIKEKTNLKKDITKEKIKLLENILDYMNNPSHNYIDTYDYVENLYKKLKP